MCILYDLPICFLPLLLQAVVKNLLAKYQSSTCFVRNDPRPRLVFKESETSRRREYSFVEAVRTLDHQLTREDLKKAYQIAGQKFVGNELRLKKFFYGCSYNI